MAKFLQVCKIGNWCLFVLAVSFLLLPFFLNTHPASAQSHDTDTVEAAAHPAKSSASDSAGIAFIAAAIATGLSSVAAGIAVAITGSAAIGAVAEKPEIMGKVLIFVALAEGIAIYGLLISIIIMTKI